MLPYIAQTYEVGRDLYYGAPYGATGTEEISVGHQYFVPLRIDNAITIKKIGIEPTATVSSAVVRAGVYKDAGLYFAKPGELLADFGTITASAAAFNETDGTVTLEVDKPGVYWFAFAGQTAAPTVRSSSAFPSPVVVPVGTSEPSAQVCGLGYRQTGVTGAFAAVARTTNLTGVAEVPWFYFQVD